MQGPILPIPETPAKPKRNFLDTLVDLGNAYVEGQEAGADNNGGLLLTNGSTPALQDDPNKKKKKKKVQLPAVYNNLITN